MSVIGPIAIVPVRSDAEVETARRLFRQYADSLGFDLGYQGFEEELAGLPGKYGPPLGEILLAVDLDGDFVGCVAVRPILEGVCEMKRLYVAPTGLGLGVGRALVRAVIREAERIGYGEMRLDTLESMTPAITLYESEGFSFIPPYNETPIAATVFMSKTLRTGRPG